MLLEAVCCRKPCVVRGYVLSEVMCRRGSVLLEALCC